MDQDPEQTASKSIEGVGQETENKAPPAFIERTWKDDFALIVECRKLYVSKAVLAYASPVFDKLFQSDFKEKNQEEMELPDKNFYDVLEFLHCICPAKLICEENVYRVLPLAEEYQVAHLKSKCELFLTSKLRDESDADEVYDMLQIALTYNMDELHKKCVTEASKKSIEELNKALKRTDAPLKTICMIQDKMIRRLEKSEQKSRSLQSVNRYLILGLNNIERFMIMNSEKWEGISLNFALNGKELQKQNHKQTKEFKMMETDAKFTVKGGPNDSLLLELSFDANELKGCIVSVFGRFVIKNCTKKNPDLIENTRMPFKDGQFSITKSMNIGKVYDAERGFINYCNGIIETEVSIIADKQSVP
ncbi:uncharacterized protein LOC123543714 [Mercenaria mercenaria]|uniref:uncharacterized protein LOC123543714 n=1 Tax=Mercenaria mercenaria TaxID=6596 RepID=UPI00234F47BE|nr:uncharacterized protein LOC123543714 [Mercenaria mercenaria]